MKLEYILTEDEVKTLGFSPKRSSFVQRQTGKRPTVWRKVFMNGSDVPFFIQSRR